MFVYMSRGLRVCLFIVGIVFKVIVVLILIFEMNFVFIYGRSFIYYVEVIGMKFFIICFVFGFFCVVVSFYLFVKNCCISK